MLQLGRREKLYVYLCGVFLTALLIGDTIGSKLFSVDIPLGLTTLHATLSVGAIWFPITFLLTDVINEFYGSQGARFVTFLGFFMAIFAFLVILAARFIPANGFSPISQDVFNNVFGNANRIFFASLCAYLLGQLLDIGVFQFAKRLTKSKHIWLRSTGSTLISQLVDTIVVTYVAFYGKPNMTSDVLRGMALTSYAVKVMLAIGLTPVIYALHTLIHRKLHIEEAPADLERVHDPVI
jgi:uncharacterized integral membrane protein (TIGR00697 family)